MKTLQPGVVPRILILEDNLIYAFELARTFRQQTQFGTFEVDVAPDVAEAMPYVERDDIDIYIVDLCVPKKTKDVDLVENGKNFVARILESSNAGIVVHSDVRLSEEGEELFALGADDYLEKGERPEIVRAQAFSLWRRIRMTRRDTNRRMVHTDRTFRILDWRFTIGHRTLTNNSGETARLSQTEHAFLSYLCTAEDHQIDRREFNVGVLGRPVHQQDQRIDNLVYRINQKIGECLRNVSKTDGTYKLSGLKEIRAH